MSQSYRQSELFAGNDWKVLYEAFTQINFNASDPTTINRAMREYIQANYSEDYNDWIESSEFVAIIDLLSWLGGTLAFKTDINTRENFLEVAESRESILRLARFLSYSPNRNQPGRGLVKLVEIETDDDISDSFGNSLNRVPVLWDDPEDLDWYEKFITVMNSAFVANNPFGLPLRSGNISNTRTELYRLNNVMSEQDLEFSSVVAGETMSFEIVNGDFTEDGGFVERIPNPNGALHLFYRNDGNGNSSDRTGFFLFFKQGITRVSNYSITTPTENLIIDLDATNVTQNEVWVQTIDDSGFVQTTWDKVPAIFSENITFNSIPEDQRDIFSVITRDEDRISVRFSDGRFGNAPVGNIRVTYRTANGLSYFIRPQEIDRVSVPIRYYNRRGAPKTLTLTFSLQENVSNAAERESEEQIKQRAPAVYASQNRMVSGEDYNTFPLQSNVATKLKAVNRVYSGHSRYIDLHDPTSTYLDTSVFSDDGMFYSEPDNLYQEIPLSLNRTPAEIISLYIQTALSSTSVKNYATGIILKDWIDGDILPFTATWIQSTDSQYSSTGWFDTSTNTNLSYIRAGALIRVNVRPDLVDGERKWVAIGDVMGYPVVQSSTSIDSYGPVTLSESIPTGSVVETVIPRYADVLTSDIISEIEDKLSTNTSFVLTYDYDAVDADSTQNPHWSIIPPENIHIPYEQSGPVFKIMSVDYISNGTWKIISRGTRLVFESQKNVEWFYDGTRTIDSETGAVREDLIKVLKLNESLSGFNTGLGLNKDYNLAIDDLYRYANGVVDPRRITVKLSDHDEDGYPDDPDTVFMVYSDVEKNTFLFWKNTVTENDTLGTFLPFFNTYVFQNETLRNDQETILDVGTIAFQIDGDLDTANSFWELTETGWERNYSDYSFAIGRGANVGYQWYSLDDTDSLVIEKPYASPINFHWKHYAPSDHRIDPAQTNIIDLFVLTNAYDLETRQWIVDGANEDTLPVPPTELDLNILFNEFDSYKMFSDEMVWRPVKYKFLFGSAAEQELKVKFKVIKLENTTLSDGEIKSRVIRAINDYFAVDNWDFGETFYFTELAAYIHQQLINVIASIVIVPLDEEASFGDGFEVRCRSDELFISTASVNDVVIINSNTASNLRIR